jgi:rhodanese-related sulfurtransferase
MAAEIEIDDAMARVAAGSYLLDVREQDEWDRGHAPQAHLIPMSVIQDRLSELPEGEPLLVICHSGMRSARVTKALLDSGYDAVSVVGGMEAWQSAGGEVVPATSQPPLA